MNTVSFIHTADNHSGCTPDGSKVRERDFYDAITRVADKAIELNVDAVLWAGDILHADRPPGTGVRAVQHNVERLKAAGIRCIGIDGNHDTDEDIDADGGRTPSGAWLSVCGIENADMRVITVKGVRIAGMAYRGKNELSDALAKLQDLEAHVLLVHQDISGLSGTPAAEVSAADLAEAAPTVSYFACGHVHKPAEAYVGDAWFVYPGSTEATAEDQAGQRYVAHVQFEGGRYKEHSMIPMPSRQFVPMTVNDADAIHAAETAAMLSGDTPTIISLSVDTEDPATVRAAVTALRRAGVLFKMAPKADKAEAQTLKDVSAHDRSTALGRLRAAVFAFFDEGTREASIILEMLARPGAAAEIAERLLAEFKAQVAERG